MKVDILAGTLALVLIAGLGTSAFAATPYLDDGIISDDTPLTSQPTPPDVLIDFEACPIAIMPSYTEDGAIVTGVPDDLICLTLSGFSGTVAIGNGAFFQPVRTDFPTLVTAVSAVVGDASTDIDGSVFMDAFDASDVLVDTDINNCGSCNSPIPLSVSAPNIAYVITGSTIDSGGSSVAVDDILFTPQPVVGGTMIPIDSTALLLVGAQMNAAWMIPVIVAAIGIGIVIARKL